MKINKHNEILTTVYINHEKFIKFKKKCIDYNFTFKYVINKTIELFNDDKFIQNYYITSGSTAI